MTSKQQFGDFVEVAGVWWAGKIESLDDKGRITSVTRQTVSAWINDKVCPNDERKNSRDASKSNSSAIRPKS